MKQVIVAGGGAAGLMAAYSAASHGARVTLIEHNEKLGRKIYITGKGRCNFTNACDIEDFFSQVVSNPKFLYSAFYTLTNTQVMELMEENGTPWKVERGNRVFPQSDHASDVTAAMERLLRLNHVKILLGAELKDILVDPIEDSENTENITNRKKISKKPQLTSRVRGIRLADGRELGCDSLILATGGRSYPSTGSTGDGYRLAASLGHQITEPRPALVPLVTAEDDITSMQGLSLKNVKLTIFDQKNRRIYSEFGEMLFTHFGISGPIVLSASSSIGRQLAAQCPLRAEIDLKASLSEEQLDARMLREIDEKHNRHYRNLYSGVLPSKLITVFLARTRIPQDLPINSITREQRESIVHLMKHFGLTITGTRPFSEAIITQGGVKVKEIDPSSMESKRAEGLYFAGELIDVDAYTGGFNLQIAWSTGYLAGMSAAEEQ